jgi:hypothetical protein
MTINRRLLNYYEFGRLPTPFSAQDLFLVCCACRKRSGWDARRSALSPGALDPTAGRRNQG